MRISWSTAAQSDLGRLHDFLAEHDLDAADQALDILIEAPEVLLDFPRRGPRLTRFEGQEIRELKVGDYVLRYELSGVEIKVLRLFHGREDRF
jgi:plasmid stabilization system protein ParE